MPGKRTLILTSFVLAVFLLQIWLVAREPSWGLYSPFPFTILRSVKMPVVIGGAAALTLLGTKASTERRLLLSIIAASIVEIVAIEAIVSVGAVLAAILVLALNAFIMLQFLRYGCDLFAQEHA
jgi:hypothetical protein